VFEEASFGIPMVYFHDWPDTTIHTNKDQPENLDATKLGRVAFMGAGIAWTLAALPEAEAPSLLAVARAAAEERLVRARLRAELGDQARDAALVVREAAKLGAETLRSVASLWPAVATAAQAHEARIRQAGPRVAPGADARVPRRNPDVRGPLDIYYYNHLVAVLGPDAPIEVALTRREGGDVLAYEALNLVDGQRTVGEIRDVLAGRYAPVPPAEVGEYLELLARAGVVNWR
jgi:hypothetical protein